MDRDLDFLDYVDPDESYESWVETGMALKSAGYSVDAWITWSMNGAKFRPGECEKKWESFRGDGVGIGTIVHRAKMNGYIPGNDRDGALEFDDTIEADEPGRGQRKPTKELVDYLKVLFKPDEYVSFVCESEENQDGKLAPARKGTYGFTAGQLIDRLMKNPDDIGAAIGDYNPEAGAWIRANPVDGKGVNDRNVTAFRHVLVESDQLSVDRQLDKIIQLNLPCAAVVSSGSKSVHAIVKVDAKDEKEYKERVRKIYQICEDNGFPVDHADKNPARLSRLPGVDRAGKHQKLIHTNIGAKDFDSWIEWAEANIDNSLPEFTCLVTALRDLPEVKEEIIGGVLRRGGKLMVAGPSKAGKSFSLIELAIALASGKSWFGNPCKRTRVLYINFELDTISCLHRFYDVSRQFGQGITSADLQNIDIWNLRGKAMPLDQLVPKLIARARARGYGMIIFDPIYKVITGDENSASDMGFFCNQFDRVTEELDCSVAYCHHYSKGAQNAKRSGDRASGSGVFARDADAIVTITELDPESSSESWEIGSADDGVSFWRVEYTLRDFKPKQPTDIAFRYPIHEVDTHGYLMDVEFADALMGSTRKKNRNFKSQEERDEDARIEFENAYSFIEADKHSVTKKDMMESTGWSESTFKRRLKLVEDSYVLTTKNGKIIKT